MLDVSLGLEIVECEAQVDAQKPGIHPLLCFIILGNKLCEHKLSPNQAGPLWGTCTNAPGGASGQSACLCLFKLGERVVKKGRSTN